MWVMLESGRLVETGLLPSCAVDAVVPCDARCVTDEVDDVHVALVLHLALTSAASKSNYGKQHL